MAYGNEHDARSFSAKPSTDGSRCVIEIATEDGVTTARLTREQTFQLGQTLLLMTGSMRDE